jgi:hypothetical protein
MSNAENRAEPAVEWENPEIVGINKEEPRASFMPGQSQAAAIKRDVHIQHWRNGSGDQTCKGNAPTIHQSRC